MHFIFLIIYNCREKGRNLNLKSRTEKRQDCVSRNAGNFLFTCLFALVLALVFPLSDSHASGISARAAIVIDSSNEEVLFAKNPDLRLPPASTTKLITAMVALDKLDPDAVVRISRKAADTPSVNPKLHAGEKLNVRDLLDLALMRSINGAAVALAEAAAGSENSFVPFMNKKAKSAGAVNTKFINASGLPGKGQHTTARDLAKIMKEALSYPVISDIIDTRVKTLEFDGKTLFLTNTNNLLWADEDHLGGKTGYTRAARHCFVGASEKEEGIIIVALLGDSSRNTLWNDAEKLLAKDFEKGTVIIDAKGDSLNIKRKKPVRRAKSRRSGTKPL
ncbi:MAG: D-alanyl-D-alanine carboxypeptidase [Nitrospiraceae bacterium]|nr:MAG: D-alanyl-D-alanine carboxypeptidase [Nitrospiraceae bacterium]